MTVKEIDPGELNRRVTSGEAIRLVDVRTSVETARGTIPDSVSLPLHLLPLQLHTLAAPGKIVFFCHSGVRSAQACMFLNMHGDREVFNLKGGILAWASTGLPIVA